MKFKIVFLATVVLFPILAFSQYAAQWIDPIGATLSNNVLTKTSASSYYVAGGARSSNRLLPNTDGWLEFTFNGQIVHIGFANTDSYLTSTFQNSIQVYGLTGINTFEGATSSSWTIALGDVFRISREGTLVKYYKNGVVFRSVTVDPGIELSIKIMIQDNGGTSPSVTASFDKALHGRPIINGIGSAVQAGMIDANVVGGVPPYTYAWNPGGAITSQVSANSPGSHTLVVTDSEGRARTLSYYLGYKNYWLNVAGASEANGILTKTAVDGWNSGANGSNMLRPGEDGWMELVAIPEMGHTLLGWTANAASLSPDAHSQMLYFLSDGTLLYWESSNNGIALGTWRVGDVYRISREGSTVKYWQNGVVLRSVTVNPSYQLFPKAILYLAGTKVPVVTTSFSSMNANATVIGIAGPNLGGSLSVSPVGVAPHTYSWSTGSISSNITYGSTGNASVQITDASGRTQSYSYGLGYKNYWLDVSGASETNGILTKTAVEGWNSGANGSNMLGESEDGWVELVATPEMGYTLLGWTTNAASLSPSVHSQMFYFLPDGALAYWESGYNGTALGSWRAGDVFRISREGSTVKYWQNGVVLRSVSVNPSYRLFPKAILYQAGTKVPAVTTSFSSMNTNAVVTGITSPNLGGSILLSPAGLAPHTYSWSTGSTSSNISYGSTGSASVQITDASGRTQSYGYGLGYKNHWLDVVGASEANGTLTKTAGDGWNSAANGSNILQPNTNGWMEFVALGEMEYTQVGWSTNSASMIPGQDNAMFFFQSGGGLVISENGTLIAIGSWRKGDVYRISREGSTLKYWRNGVLLRTVSTSPSYRLFPKTIIYQAGSKVPPVTTSYNNYAAQWIDPVGPVTLNNNILTKTGASGYNTIAGARSSNRLLPNADGWIEFTYNGQNLFIGFVVHDAYYSNTWQHAVQYMSPTQLNEWNANNSGTADNYMRLVAIGDVLRISREGAFVKYYRNGVVFSTVAVDPALELNARVMISDNGVSVHTVYTSFDKALHSRPIINGIVVPSQNGTIDANIIGGVPPYTYSWGSGSTTSLVTANSPGNQTLTATDSEGRIRSITYGLGHKNDWLETVNCSMVNGILTKTGTNNNWDCGANGSNILQEAADGWLEFVATPKADMERMFIGWSTNRESVLPAAEYSVSFYFDGVGRLYAYENYLGDFEINYLQIGTYRTGDIFRLSREEGAIKYWQNGVLLRTLQEPFGHELFPKVLMDHPGAKVPVVTTSTGSSTDCYPGGFNFTNQQYLCAVKFTSTRLVDCTSTYEWDFGDEQTSNEINPMHVYEESGTYDVTVTVTLNCGECESTRTVTHQVTYTAPASIDLVEDVLVQAESDTRIQVINSSVSTFTDSWPLPFEADQLEDKSGYWNSSIGVWRNKSSFVFNTPRFQSPTINTRIDGTYSLNRFNWQYAEYDVVPNWIKANTITRYSAYGFETENQDALGNYSSAVYDYQGQLPVANGVNMKNSEMAFTSFESVVNATGQFIPENRITGNWVFGEQSQSVPEFFMHKIQSAKKYVAIVEAKPGKFYNGMYVAVFPDNSKAIPTNNIVCVRPHPQSPDLSLVVLNLAPNSMLWKGMLKVKNVVEHEEEPIIDDAIKHSGNYSLKIEDYQNFKQEIIKLDSGKSYWVSAWVSVGNSSPLTPHLGDELEIGVEFLRKGTTNTLSSFSLTPSGPVIEGWQQIKGKVHCNFNNTYLNISFSPGDSGPAWYDDLRLHPEEGNMKTYVYDVTDFRLKAILDEENFASFFYYDKEGNLYLTKKETVDGVKTLSENVSFMKTN